MHKAETEASRAKREAAESRRQFQMLFSRIAEVVHYHEENPGVWGTPSCERIREILNDFDKSKL